MTLNYRPFTPWSADYSAVKIFGVFRKINEDSENNNRFSILFQTHFGLLLFFHCSVSLVDGLMDLHKVERVSECCWKPLVWEQLTLDEQTDLVCSRCYQKMIAKDLARSWQSSRRSETISVGDSVVGPQGNVLQVTEVSGRDSSWSDFLGSWAAAYLNPLDAIVEADRCCSVIKEVLLQVFSLDYGDAVTYLEAKQSELFKPIVL
jgi:hypothetical protein